MALCLVSLRLFSNFEVRFLRLRHVTELAIWGLSQRLFGLKARCLAWDQKAQMVVKDCGFVLSPVEAARMSG